MAERSVFSNVMLFIIAAILLVGFYLTIDVVDISRQRQERLVDEVVGVRSEVARLREAVGSGGFTAPLAGTPASSQQARVKFANEDLRDPNAVDGDAIVTATRAETANMNYLLNNEALVGDLWTLTYDSVAERNYNNPNVFEPQLAERWEVSDDKLTYTIHLRPGVLWHDFTDPTTGERFEDVEVTSDDFKFFLEVMRNPKIPCEPSRVYYKDLDEIRVVDKYTFQVVWREPYFMSETLTLGLAPLPRHFYRFDPDKADEEFNENFERNRMIVGCGPWVFEKWEKGRLIALRRNEKYYGPKPHLKRRTIKVIKEPAAALQALRNGELDRIGLLPEQWATQTNDEDFTARFNKFKYFRQAYYYIGYNERRDLFSDRRVRVALTHLVNRKRIVDEVYLGLARPVTGNFYIDGPYYNHSIEPYPFDIAKAKELLAEADWRDTDGDGILDRDGKKFEFVLLTVSGGKTFERIAEIMREDCAKAGIVVSINPVEWSVYTQRLDEWNFDVCALGWISDGWEADPYQIWHSSQADIKKSSNHIGFKNAEADRIIETARREFDVKKRIELYHRFHEILHEEQPYTFLVTPYSLVVQDKRFRNAKVYPHPRRMHSNSFWVPLAEQKYRD